MHYRKQAFSKNGGITIQTLDASKQDIIGKGSEVRIKILNTLEVIEHLQVSVGDIELVKKMYGCDDKGDNDIDISLRKELEKNM